MNWTVKQLIVINAFYSGTCDVICTCNINT